MTPQKQWMILQLLPKGVLIREKRFNGTNKLYANIYNRA